MARAVDSQGRIRPLRKSAAIEDEGEPASTGQPTQQQPPHFPPQSLLIPQHPHNLTVGLQPPPTIPTVTDYSLAAQLTSIGLTIPSPSNAPEAQSATSLPIHPTAIKHEQTPLSRDDLLSTFGLSNTLANSWMTLNNPVGVTALASLKALMQANESDVAARLAAVSSEDIKPQFVDMGKLLENRNHSTESTASTSTASGTQCSSGLGAGSGPCASGESIPRKQDIQTDIRMNKGRFQLVRKRGRSEVWNLFGQVVDTLTGNRLPYVACYACKVLYTDTGGGTGNMTRHRCSVGHSYRSIAGSSTDTIGEVNTQSSFESVNNLGLNGPPSPDTYIQISYLHRTSTSASVGASQYSVSAREAFIQSGGSSGHVGSAGGSLSSGFMSGGSASMSMSTLASLDSIGSMAGSIHGGSLRQSYSLIHPHREVPAATTTSNQPQRPTAITTANPPGPVSGAFGPGYVFTQADKQLFAQAVVQFCAQDLHNYDVVEGEGFKNLVETVLFIGRRSHGDVTATSFDPVRNLIPSAKQLKQVFNSQEQYVRQATLADLGAAKHLGISLSCQSITFSEERYLGLSCNYITEDWAITRRFLRVEKCSLNDVGNIIEDLMREYNLESAKTILLSLDLELDSAQLGNLPKNVVLVSNVNRAINHILRQSLNECAEKNELISSFIDLCYRIVKELNGLNALADSLPHKFFAGLEHHTSSLDKRFDYADGVYLTIKFVRDHIDQILLLFGNDLSHKRLISEIQSIDWNMAKDLEQFLEPFFETVQIFKDSKQPHFQRILPEWYALMHECQHLSTETPDSEAATMALGSPHSPPSSRDLVSKSNISTSTVIVDTSAASELSSPPMQVCTRSLEQSASSAPTSQSTGEWLAVVRKTANNRLKEWATKNMLLEHKIATALNPRLKHLNLVCSHSERSAIYSRIRAVVGLNKPKQERHVDTTADEPAKKRREFLDRLEDCAAEDDELDCYLRTSFPPNQTKSVLEFWSTVGERQFPRLAKLARFLLPTSGACAPLSLSQPSTSPTSSDINTLLILRPEVLNSLNRSHTQPRSAFPRL
ncbi:hAT family dimerization domain containing protein [Ditylenchus destructor]|uniref:HAT family dimerization domain containing protein n=1 Tax=Ditylenchus destructor TaxID=166010 RepID=A0AAD4NIL3_9BILA|nr:hAT family dimerization domain containing protein [Ditylenchus destructor]